MRTYDQIDADIIAAEKALRALHKERRGIIGARNSHIIADFDAGHTIKRIAFDHDLTNSAVACVLHRAGRTVKGRKKLKDLLANRCIVEGYAAKQAALPAEQTAVAP